MIDKIFTLRLLNEFCKSYFSSLGLAVSPVNTVEFSCTNCKIVKGRARFFKGKELFIDAPLDSFLWMPLGEKIDVEESSIDTNALTLSFKDKFHYTIKVENDLFDIHAHSVVYIGTNYYFYDKDGMLVYTVPYAYMEFVPNNIIPSNLRIWNPFTGTMSDEAFYKKYGYEVDIVGKNGEPGHNGENGTSGTSGTSSRDGHNGEPGVQGENGAMYTEDINSTHLKFIVNANDLSILKSCPISIINFTNEQVIDITSAILVSNVVNPICDIDIALCVGTAIIGGWENVMQKNIVQKCAFFDNVNYKPDNTLMIKSIKDTVIEGTITVYVSFRFLSQKY